jgi:peptide/nickel transport system ATP-binding protein
VISSGPTGEPGNGRGVFPLTEPLLKVEHLTLDFETGAGKVHALRDVSFEMEPGHVLGIVGETGCGKSTLGHTIARLVPEPPARILSGKIEFQGTDLVKVPKWKMPMIRGTGIGMIFQEPINSLNPAFRIYDQVAEAVRIRRLRESGKTPTPKLDQRPFDYSRLPPPKTSEALPGAVGGKLGEVLVESAVSPEVHRGRRAVGLRSSKELRGEVLDFLRLVRINDPETILGLYPHELSGGMRQRIMIAMALSERPVLLIADEPTSALDVTIQAQVLTLMKELLDEIQTSILFISHDLAVIAEMTDDVGVMYAGGLVEFGPVEEIFESPRHPYTKALLRSFPNRYKSDGPLPSLPGSVPNLSQLPQGCVFEPRCPLARPVCTEPPGPKLTSAGEPGANVEHRAACFFSLEVKNLP